MRITEVVRGRDLLRSTFRQLLIYRALGFAPPGFRHLPLVHDDQGERLAKRSGAWAVRGFRERGLQPAALRDRLRELAASS